MFEKFLSQLCGFFLFDTVISLRGRTCPVWHSDEQSQKSLLEHCFFLLELYDLLNRK